MDEVIVLNSDLEIVGVVDNFVSLIWTKRFWAVGDCELYVVATSSLRRRTSTCFAKVTT